MRVALGSVLFTLAACGSGNSDGGKQAGKVETTVGCEQALKRFLLDENSFDPHLAGWVYSTDGLEGFVRREYTSKNGLSAEISAEYHCTFDLNAQEVIFLRTDGPGGLRTLINRPAINGTR
ncbi:hypothetical protein [Pontixanthobacter sp. CEM42]|uniref:hypothetical protein n=1 Tax=Pontixanthobacter sp. CEM42 TaxID=2792077 RepID=UPI001ADFB015|nr:hypothetical protein [Pontixanthobacter sp. CEM42]